MFSGGAVLAFCGARLCPPRTSRSGSYAKDADGFLDEARNADVLRLVSATQPRSVKAHRLSRTFPI